MALISALLLTIVLELAVVMVLVTENRKEYIKDSILMNTFTNPLLNIMIVLLKISSSFVIWLLEGCVVMTEAILWKKLENMENKEALKLSFLSNLVSYILGGILYAYFL